MKTILALDCATRTGWAVLNGTSVEFGVQDFSPARGDSPGMRFLNFRRWLEMMVIDNGVDAVVYERAHHRGGAATEVCVGLTTRVQEVCAERQIEFMAVAPSTLKKWATGSGRANKGDMIAGARARLPADRRLELTDDNEADALLLALYLRKQIGE